MPVYSQIVEEFIVMLQEDLCNERKHLAFYLLSSSLVLGEMRSEMTEYLLAEAQEEMQHVNQFSNMIVYLGGYPGTSCNEYPTHRRDAKNIFQYIGEMEKEVSEIYARRIQRIQDIMKSTETVTSEMVAMFTFYQKQLAHSWESAKEVEQTLNGWV